ncbi:acyclic terpene utilization AtuA family protein [Jiulongibacter sp. NS-SX5]|uniref:acyclic terpene utilization AtuA family protein n=1 Tax=Jiulongibacter sp. NS-SX5 TaxID=3463854 RepID=UPI004059F2D5
MKKIRIGCGAGFSGDRLEPAVLLADKANLNYLVLECLAERTIALAQKQKMADPNSGFDPFLERRISSLLPYLAKNKITLITNMGAANPIAAAKKALSIAQKEGIKIKIAAVYGDDVLEQLTGNEITLESQKAIKESGEILSANAYMGVNGILDSLRIDAQIIITGRVSDPSLFLAPMIHEFGWETENLLGQGTVIGHLLECAGQLTGGYFMDTTKKQVPDPANLGHPFAEISADGTALFSKIKGTGGLLNLQTVKEQLLYEVINPYAYQTPDITADFSTVRLEKLDKDLVKVTGGTGKPAPEKLKVSVGYRAFYMGEGEISYTGTDSLQRAELAADILKKRLEHLTEDIRVDFIGQNAIVKGKNFGNDILEVRLRIAAKCNDENTAKRIGEEVEALYTNGPAGGGGVRKQVKEVVGIHSIFLNRDMAKAKTLLLE